MSPEEPLLVTLPSGSGARKRGGVDRAAGGPSGDAVP
jgi:hypothetical protein